MKKNLIQPDVKDEILSRINKLNVQTQRQWGKMNLNQMLRHNIEAFQMSYGEIKSAIKPPNFLIKKLMRFMILDTDIPAPKGKAETFPEINQVSKGVDPPDFNAERNKLLELVKTFPSKQTNPVSARLGEMTQSNWGRLMYTHLDHHLRQFGV